MKLGTHNSGTGGKLLWWLTPFKKLLDLTSKCQDRTIEEQVKDGVSLLNLQVTRYKGTWVFSHGLAIYREELIPTLHYLMRQNKTIYFQLFLDDNLFLGQPCEAFRELVKEIKELISGSKLKLHYAWIEGSKEYYYGEPIALEEHYWSLGWAKCNAESIIDCFPLPKRHALKYNKAYKENCKTEYLMLDYYDK